MTATFAALAARIAVAPFAVIDEEEIGTLCRCVELAPALIAERIAYDARVHLRCDNYAKHAIVKALADDIAKAAA
jgi:hypothetical protein